MPLQSSIELLSNSGQAQLKLAKIWQERGQIDRAIAGYHKAIELRKHLVLPYIELGKLLLAKGDLSEAFSTSNQAININPNYSEVHKNLVNSLLAQNKKDQLLDYYKLTRKDEYKININSADILCFVVVRNESLRLPYFLAYYREKGIRKFFIIDNNSTDETANYLLKQPDVYLWQSEDSYQRSNFGTAWIEVLLRIYEINNWCLIVDADEIFYYPDCEQKTIIDLCQQLDHQQKKAFKTILLDMYSDKPIRDTYYEKGQNFLDACPYFDRKFYHKTCQENEDPYNPYHNQKAYFGGMRQRVFGEKGEYYLSKVPLIKYNPEVIIGGGQHWTNFESQEIANDSGCLLHFKYFHSFGNYVREEVVRKQHCGGAMQYQEYAKEMDKNEELILYNPKYSVKLENSQQLVNLGVMEVEIN
ncbi:hypothetical protein GM3709_1420 [Geminocystis sp. NIES-3709]|nr:hypothetical protein GM3709_1420 [Geminocystis sp. NIES-3709]